MCKELYGSPEGICCITFWRPIPSNLPRLPTTEEDAGINQQIRDIQTKEQETNIEQAEHDTEIAEIFL
jgi:hypothetical protein